MTSCLQSRDHLIFGPLDDAVLGYPDSCIYDQKSLKMSLLNLPNELLQLITHHLGEERDINALIQTSRFFRDSFNEYLYEYNIKKHSGSAILWAAENGSLELAQRLLDGGTSAEYKWDAEKKPIALAAANGHEEMVELLLTNCADPDGMAPLRRTRYTALHFAALGGYNMIARHLISEGADVNGKTDIQNDTPLHAAVENNHLSTVRLLVNHRAALDQMQSYEWTPLYIAVDKGHMSIVDFLLDRGATPDGIGEDSTPLQVAVEHGNVTIAQLLLDFGACVDIEDDEGRTPLIAAAELGSVTMVDLLLPHLFFDDSELASARALSLAVSKGHEDTARRLLEAGLDPNWGDYP